MGTTSHSSTRDRSDQAGVTKSMCAKSKEYRHAFRAPSRQRTVALSVKGQTPAAVRPPAQQTF
jgi:hypothetical protein